MKIVGIIVEFLNITIFKSLRDRGKYKIGQNDRKDNK